MFRPCHHLQKTAPVHADLPQEPFPVKDTLLLTLVVLPANKAFVVQLAALLQCSHGSRRHGVGKVMMTFDLGGWWWWQFRACVVAGVLTGSHRTTHTLQRRALTIHGLFQGCGHGKSLRGVLCCIRTLCEPRLCGRCSLTRGSSLGHQLQNCCIIGQCMILLSPSPRRVFQRNVFIARVRLWQRSDFELNRPKTDAT